MAGIKSSYEIALEKINKMGIDDAQALTGDQRELVAEIRKKYDAKIAERKILLKNAPELPDEIRKLEQQRDEEIQEIYST